MARLRLEIAGFILLGIVLGVMAGAFLSHMVPNHCQAEDEYMRIDGQCVHIDSIYREARREAQERRQDR
jgi:hypothetical protein